MSTHANVRLEDCPECSKADGWQGTHGLRLAAQHIRHEATTDQDLDLADVCQWVAETHYPVDGFCAGCGEPWDSVRTFPDVKGELQCSTYLATRVEKNFWIVGKVRAISGKWVSADV